MMPRRDAHEFDAAVLQLLDGTLDAADQIRLQSQMKADDSVRLRYLQLAMLETSLRGNLLPRVAVSKLQAAELVVPARRARPLTVSLGAISHPVQMAWRWMTGSRLVVTLCLAMLVYGAFGIVLSTIGPDVSSKRGGEFAGTGSGSEGEPNRMQQVATVVDARDCKWLDTEPGKQDFANRRLSLGNQLKLASGVATILFDSGVVARLVGPSEFEICQAGVVRLGSGQLVARVPRTASGFTVATAAAEIVDLGTEFCVEASAEGETSVHVREGAVELRRASEAQAAGTRLIAGQGASVTASGDLTSIAAESRRFPQVPPEYSQERTKSESKPLTGLVAYFPFDSDTKDHADEYQENRGASRDNLVMIGKSELILGKVGSALRLTGGFGKAPASADLQLPGKFTIESWVVVERFGNDQRLICSGVNANDQSYYLGLFGKALNCRLSEERRQSRTIKGGVVCKDRWEHFALVGDGSRATVYLNGLPIAQTDYDGTLHAASGGLGLGEPPYLEKPSPYVFHGSFDELALWAVDLSPEQIQSHVRAGRRGYGLVRK